MDCLSNQKRNLSGLNSDGRVLLYHKTIIIIELQNSSDCYKSHSGHKMLIKLIYKQVATSQMSNCPYAQWRSSTWKWLSGTKRDHSTIHSHEDSNPMSSCLSPLVTQREVGVQGLCHFHPRSTSTYSKEHTQQPSSQQGLLLRGQAQGSTWLTPGGRRVGTVSGLISLTGMEMVGEQCPPPSTHTCTHRSLSHHQCRREQSMTGPNANSPQRDHPVTATGLASQ